MGFDGAPTADSEVYGKLDKSVREVHESQVVLLNVFFHNVAWQIMNLESLFYYISSLHDICLDYHDRHF